MAPKENCGGERVGQDAMCSARNQAKRGLETRLDSQSHDV